MTCVFCERITNHEYTGSDYNSVWFEPLNPVVPGHMLFVPKSHVPDASIAPVITGRTMFSAAMYADARSADYNLITSKGKSATQSIFHLHIHYVPRKEGDGLALPWTGQHND